MAVAFRMAQASKEAWAAWERDILDQFSDPAELEKSSARAWEGLKLFASARGWNKKGAR